MRKTSDFDKIVKINYTFIHDAHNSSIGTEFPILSFMEIREAVSFDFQHEATEFT